MTLTELHTNAELWERYVRFLEGGGDVDAASSALQRSTQVHCKQRPEAHLFAAHFQEQQGDAASARASLEIVIDQQAEGDVKVQNSVRSDTACYMHVGGTHIDINYGTNLRHM